METQSAFEKAREQYKNKTTNGVGFVKDIGNQKSKEENKE